MYRIPVDFLNVLDPRVHFPGRTLSLRGIFYFLKLGNTKNIVTWWIIDLMIITLLELWKILCKYLIVRRLVLQLSLSSGFGAWKSGLRRLSVSGRRSHQSWSSDTEGLLGWLEWKSWKSSRPSLVLLGRDVEGLLGRQGEFHALPCCVFLYQLSSNKRSKRVFPTVPRVLPLRCYTIKNKRYPILSACRVAILDLRALGRADYWPFVSNDRRPCSDILARWMILDRSSCTCAVLCVELPEWREACILRLFSVVWCHKQKLQMIGCRKGPWTTYCFSFALVPEQELQMRLGIWSTGQSVS